MLRSVDVRAEPGTLFGQLSVGRERKHLKTAAVGQNRAVPSVELVQTAGLFENLDAGAQIEMICIAENDLGLHILAQFALMHSLDTADCPYGHENRSADLAVVSRDQTGAGGRAGSGSF